MKMTFIDKNKFIQDVIKRKYSQASLRLIREQPEVEAIPIEWIKYHIRALQISGSYTDAMLLTDMIDLWEKENDLHL